MAPGARAWAIVTSNVVSSAQPTAPQRFALGALVKSEIVFTGQVSVPLPVHVGPQSMVTVVGGRLKVLSNVFKSVWMVGLPNASTITMVDPFPLRPSSPNVDGKL